MNEENRRAARRSSLYMVTAVIGEKQVQAKVKDHSKTGCRLILEEAVSVNEGPIKILRNDMEVNGQIVWRNRTTIGVHFTEAFNPEMFSLARKENSALKPAIRVNQEEPYRRPGLKPQKLTVKGSEHARIWATGRHLPKD